MRIPRDRAGCRIEVIVVSMVDREMKLPAVRALEPLEQTALDRIVREICLSGAIVSIGTRKPRGPEFYRAKLARFRSLSHLTVEVRSI